MDEKVTVNLVFFLLPLPALTIPSPALTIPLPALTIPSPTLTIPSFLFHQLINFLIN